MAEQFIGDPDFSQDELKKEREYFHEALQRLIINFLAENTNQEFMVLGRSEKHRPVSGPEMAGSTTTTYWAESSYQERSTPVKRSAQEMESDREIESVSGLGPPTKAPRKE